MKSAGPTSDAETSGNLKGFILLLYFSCLKIICKEENLKI